MWKHVMLTIASAGMMASCAIGPHYPDLKKSDSSSSRGPSTPGQMSMQRYAFADWLSAHPRLPNPAVIVTMSGGGTRAATLAYDTLERMNEVQVPCQQGTMKPDASGGCSLLDHVIVVSGISGGSFTASQFAVHGRGMFRTDLFRKKVLERNLKAAVGWMLVEPWYWLDRTQKMVDVFNEEGLLGHKTYGDLQRSAEAPFLLLAATDIVSGRSFPLDQDLFDDLCADIAKMEIARGVAAAGSLPYAVNGINLENYRATSGCGVKTENFVTPTARLLDEAKSSRINSVLAARSRYRLWMRGATTDGWTSFPNYPEFSQTPLSRRTQFVHLFDGGLADNLGLRQIANFISDPATLVALSEKGVRNVLLIEINARSEAPTSRSQSSLGPSFIGLLQNTASGAVDRVTELSAFAAENYINVVLHSPRPQGLPSKQEIPYPTIYVNRIDADLLPLKADGGELEADDRLREAFKAIDTFQSLNGERLGTIRALSRRLLDGAPCQIYGPTLRLTIEGELTSRRYHELAQGGCSVFDERFDMLPPKSMPMPMVRTEQK